MTDARGHDHPAAGSTGENLEPLDPHQLPLAHLGREPAADTDHTAAQDASAPVSHRRLWWLVGATAAVVVVGMVIGIIVFNRSATKGERGARTAREAATQFVTSINADSEPDALAVSCDSFINDARAALRQGEDPAFRMRLVSVDGVGGDTAVAVISEQLRVSGRTQKVPAHIAVLKDQGLWLMCGLLS